MTTYEAAYDDVLDGSDNTLSDLDGFGDFNAASPHAAALIPMLRALNWRGDIRDVAEALPHFSNTLDLVDLRNVLVALGYESEPRAQTIDEIDPRLCPCLYVTEDDQPLVVLQPTDETIEIIEDGHRKSIPRGENNGKGVSYYFTTCEFSERFSKDNTRPWFETALMRFKKAVYRLLSMTFVINLMSIAVPLFVMTVYDKVIGNGSIGTLPYLIVGVVFILGADILLRILRARLIGAVAGRIDYLMGVETLGRILGLPAGFTERTSVSSQISRIKQFESIREFFAGPLAFTALDLPFTLLFISIIAILGGLLALIPIAMVIVLCVFGAIYLPRTKKLNAEAGAASSSRQDFVIEAATHLQNIKAAGGEDIWRSRYRLMSSHTLTAQHKAAQRASIMQSAAQSIMTFSGVAVLGFGALKVMAGTMSVGALVAVMALVWRVLSPFNAGFLAYGRLTDIRKSVAQVNQLMRLQPERQRDKTSLLSKEFTGDISLIRTSFRYSADTDPALIGASLRIKPMEFMTIIGANGSGKSTILKLIAGLYQPQGGAVTVDGLDLRQVDPIQLRRQISYVPQTADLFYGTIAQNLRLVDPTATDKRLEEVAKRTGLFEAIQALPRGFETRVGDALIDQLPTGFVQRLNIARALTRDSKIFLLDEPATSLDFDGDEMLMNLLKSLKGTKTIVMVSHRPSHVRLGDQATVLNRGFLEFVGEPDQALAFADAL
jgi:ATP-binding cassette subfamily C protein/ATP-binding cassette subfamily C protein LapB